MAMARNIIALFKTKEDEINRGRNGDSKRNYQKDNYIAFRAAEASRGVCHIYIMTGRQRHKWQHLISKIEDFAKEEGCEMMELIARPGWQKVYNNHGYKKTHVVLEKQIKQEDKI